MNKAWHERRQKAVHAAVWNWPGIKLGGYAGIYGMSRQAIYSLSKKYNLTTDHWSFVKLLHEVLIECGKDSPLRRRISDPAESERLQAQIYQKLDDEHAKHIDAVRRTWHLPPIFKGKDRTPKPSAKRNKSPNPQPANQSIKPALK